MRKNMFFVGLCLTMLLGLLTKFGLQVSRAASVLEEQTLVLYDASSGDIPDSSVIGFTAFPPEGASMRYEDGSTVLDTAIAGTDTYAGWGAGAAGANGFPSLDSTTGVHVNFTLQVESETHDSNHRSGFSVIILDSNARGIEMSFWQNEIWVQNDDSTGALFTHGEGVAFDTTALTEYQITMIGDTYALTANSQPILTGPMRDYSAFDRFPDPYETPNFIFLGDDTTSAQARVRLHFLSVTGTEPVAPTNAVTSTSTILPQPTLASTPFPSVTQAPLLTPTPVNPVSSLCPSGWLVGAVMLAGLVISKITSSQ